MVNKCLWFLVYRIVFLVSGFLFAVSVCFFYCLGWSLFAVCCLSIVVDCSLFVSHVLLVLFAGGRWLFVAVCCLLFVVVVAGLVIVCHWLL